MNEIRGRRTRPWWMVARTGLALAVTLVLAGCAGAGYGTTSTPPTTSSPVSAGAGGQVIGTATGDLGTYLTGDSGRALYLWEGDTAGGSSCTGGCASVWPPVLTTGAPQASAGVDASLLGTTTRADGGLQVTYQGHPLYYFASDTSAGQTTGQGSNGFGAKWWLVSPSGDAITGSAGTGTSGSSSDGAPGRGGY